MMAKPATLLLILIILSQVMCTFRIFYFWSTLNYSLYINLSFTTLYKIKALKLPEIYINFQEKNINLSSMFSSILLFAVQDKVFS